MRQAGYLPWLGRGVVVATFLLPLSACRSMGKGNKTFFPLAPAGLFGSGAKVAPGGAQLAADAGQPVSRDLETSQSDSASQTSESAPGMACVGGVCSVVNNQDGVSNEHDGIEQEMFDSPQAVGLVNHQQMLSQVGMPPSAKQVDQAVAWDELADQRHNIQPLAQAEPQTDQTNSYSQFGSYGQVGAIANSEVYPRSLADQPPLELPPSSAPPGKANAGPSTTPAALSAASPAGFTVRVYVQGVRPGRGAVKVALFTDPRTFPIPQYAIAAQSFADGEPHLVADFQLPSPTAVAVAVFQDLDSNGSLTRGRAGVPVEPCAFSNDAAIRRGPPAFSDAAVTPPSSATDESMSIVVKLP